MIVFRPLRSARLPPLQSLVARARGFTPPTRPRLPVLPKAKGLTPPALLGPISQLGSTLSRVASIDLPPIPLPLVAAAVISTGDANPVNALLGLVGQDFQIPVDAPRVGRIDTAALGTTRGGLTFNRGGLIR